MGRLPAVPGRTPPAGPAVLSPLDPAAGAPRCQPGSANAQLGRRPRSAGRAPHARPRAAADPEPGRAPWLDLGPPAELSRFGSAACSSRRPWSRSGSDARSKEAAAARFGGARIERGSVHGGRGRRQLPPGRLSWSGAAVAMIRPDCRYRPFRSNSVFLVLGSPRVPVFNSTGCGFHS